MHKKIVCLILLVFFIANASAYTTTYQISKPDSIIPTREFWHWITIDWTYDGPAEGDQSWTECTFEDSDKNYGIEMLDLNSSEITMLEEFGPVTSTDCEVPPTGTGNCTARTTYFFKLKTSNTEANTDYNISLKIKGKCGVTEVEPTEEPYNPNIASASAEASLKETKKTKNKETKIFFGAESNYPIYIDYNYGFTVNTILANSVPALNVISRWGKTDGIKNALIQINAHDPELKDINKFDLIMPADCTGTMTNTPLNQPDVNTEIELACQQKNTKQIVDKN